MRISYIITALLLSACATPVAVKMPFPEAPPALLTKCQDLKQTTDTRKLSEVVTVVVENYGQYYDCKNLTDSWQQWYESQKKINQSVK
jgi:hypothetical protein